MKNTQPRFSVVVPSYNEEDYLAQTLESLLDQDFKGSYEIIVVDNNSTDSTVSVAKSFNVKVVTEKRSGVCWARQKGTETALGEIIVSTDADTTFSQDWLSNIDAGFTGQSVVAVAGPCKFVDPPYWGVLYPYLLFGFVSKVFKLTGRPPYISATNIAFRKSTLVRYNTALSQGGDELDLLRNLKKHGTVVFNNSNPTFTSSRRLKRGFFYNFFVTLIYYYILEYSLNRLFKTTLIGNAPTVRENPQAEIEVFDTP